MTHIDPNDVGRMPPEDRPAHVGPHHYANCGAYRPVANNHKCPYCPERCPECGATYRRREVSA